MRAFVRRLRLRWERWLLWREFARKQRGFVEHELRGLERVGVADMSLAVWAWACGQLLSVAYGALAMGLEKTVAARDGDDSDVERIVELKEKLDMWCDRGVQELEEAVKTPLEAVIWASSRGAAAPVILEAVVDFRRERERTRRKAREILGKIFPSGGNTA